MARRGCPAATWSRAWPRVEPAFKHSFGWAETRGFLLIRAAASGLRTHAAAIRSAGPAGEDRLGRLGPDGPLGDRERGLQKTEAQSGRDREGAAVVVDVTNSPSFEDAAVMKFFTTSTHNLLTLGGSSFEFLQSIASARHSRRGFDRRRPDGVRLSIVRWPRRSEAQVAASQPSADRRPRDVAVVQSQEG
jgi:hypothetical protein